METDDKLSETIKREELFTMVWKEPATKLAAQFQIPYPEFKKICDNLSVPLPGSGYWSKLRAGKPIPEAILPANYSGPLEVVIEPKVIEKRAKSLPTLPEGCDTGAEKLIKVSAKLVNPDPLIVAVKDKLEKPKYLHDGLAWSGSEYISIKVTPKNASRALRFMDAFIKLLKARGHDLIVEYHTTYAFIKNEKFELRLREKTIRNIVKEGSWDRTINTPSGILIFHLDEYPRREWKDGKLLLEDRLGEIVYYLEQKGKEKKEQKIRWQKEEEERQERERIQRELEARQEKELAGFKNLLQDAKRWKEVKILREYIADMKSDSTLKTNHAEAHEAWVKWAEEKADWYDPQINLADELMNNVDKETLTLKKKSIYHGW
ncbi:hypothetical protein I2I11_13095 [Pontibacter sp. 172403-2]|uniref:hypothetical protein n=1 Tax=Pontibacter rufus TaxID=2791028 RepID=UPI0018AF848A|nr:hypothetical protein [Pontibacter sp. 172403-2]MBF9254235.1 hypothetical protein [Pontibacter sp. 172403-2]